MQKVPNSLLPPGNETENPIGDEMGRTQNILLRTHRRHPTPVERVVNFSQLYFRVSYKKTIPIETSSQPFWDQHEKRTNCDLNPTFQFQRNRFCLRSEEHTLN